MIKVVDGDSSMGQPTGGAQSASLWDELARQGERRLLAAAGATFVNVKLVERPEDRPAGTTVPEAA